MIPRLSAAGFGAGILLCGAIAAILTRTPFGVAIGCGLLGVAILVRLVTWRRHRPFCFEVTVGGLVWNDPARGECALAWRDVGAVAVIESVAAGEEASALLIVPREREAGPGCALAARALAAVPVAGVRRLKEAAAQILPRLPADVIIDRKSRMSLIRWGLDVKAP
ncbi:MAG: hypothetical protein AAB368_16275 [bacterium]